MPNHITNVLTITAINVQQIKEEIAGPERLFDFNSVIQMPESLHIEASTFVEAAEWLQGGDEPRFGNKTKEEWLKLFGDKADEILRQGALRITNKKSFGFADWYGWAPANWGTKWNSYDNAERGESIKFETAWCCPEPVMKALSAKYPDAEFKLEYADEDRGSNCGTLIFKSGAMEIIEIAPTWSEQSEKEHRKWRKFALQLQHPGADPKDHGMDDNYEYIEE